MPFPWPEVVPVVVVAAGVAPVVVAAGVAAVAAAVGVATVVVAAGVVAVVVVPLVAVNVATALRTPFETKLAEPSVFPFASVTDAAQVAGMVVIFRL